MSDLAPLDAALLPPGVRARFVPGVNGLTVHLLEAGAGEGRPLVLLLHGFPELAYSWRKVLPVLAACGYHAVAPDLRGYGRTTGWTARYDDELMPFRMLNYVRDALALVHWLGHRAAAVVGHDYGSPVAANCALLRPDVFRAVALMSAPYGGLPALPLGDATPAPQRDVHADLAALPRPRKHYQWYYSTREAEADMLHAPQGLPAFLRAYYHAKSADWPGNQPHPLAGWTAEALAELPTYYVMDLAADMPASVAPEMPSPEAVAANAWLPERDLRVYADEYARTGFQGGLNTYRCTTTGRSDADLLAFAGRSIDVPSLFIAGRADWGVYQRPGAFERMQGTACTRMLGAHLVDGAGHWVQQEQPEAVNALLLRFLAAAV